MGGRGVSRDRMTVGGMSRTVRAGSGLSKRDSDELAIALATMTLPFRGDFRSALYKTARLIGDYRALTGGPRAMARRLARRLAGRVSGRLFRKLFR